MLTFGGDERAWSTFPQAFRTDNTQVFPFFTECHHLPEDILSDRSISLTDPVTVLVQGHALMGCSSSIYADLGDLRSVMVKRSHFLQRFPVLLAFELLLRVAEWNDGRKVKAVWRAE